MHIHQCRLVDMHDAPALFRLLGDEVRLRMLRVLQAERLNVTELTSILGIAQSGVSRHLGLLKEAGLVTEQREGGYTYFRLSPGLADARNGLGPLAALLDAHFGDAAHTETGRADDVRLAEVRRLRKENFDVHGGPDTQARQLVPGRSWAAWARALGRLLPPLEVADLGCGEGYLTIEASRWASRVLAVDHSPTVLKRAQALAARRRVRNITWRRGELEKLPIRDASIDVALLSQALHHARDPRKAVGEASRILVPGGRILVLDLREHDETWVRERLGDRWLGFTSDRLKALLEEAGFLDAAVSVGARRTGDAFTVLIASGRKPSAGDRAADPQIETARRPRAAAHHREPRAGRSGSRH
jgi:ArsR family transcriptional regulator